MGFVLISSRSNPLVRLARSLRERKAREETGLFLVEGIHHVGEAVQAGWQIDAILYSPAELRSDFAKELLARYAGRQEAVSADVMESIASKENPVGIAAVVHQRLGQLNDLSGARRALAVIAPQDPGNVGTILRTMEACGSDILFLLDGGVDPFHPTAIRAAMGASFWRPIVKASFGELVAWARSHESQLIATSAHAERSYLEWAPHDPWILVLGSEQRGLTPEQMKACDVAVSIPITGRVSSLNLAVAAGILLYHMSAGSGPRMRTG